MRNGAYVLLVDNADWHRSMLSRLCESEVAFNVIAVMFCALFASALMVWALVYSIRNGIAGEVSASQTFPIGRASLHAKRDF